MPHVTVVIPVLNEGSLINELVNRVNLNVQILTQDYEIIIVDDGSVDDTWTKIKRNALDDERIKGIKLSRNFGHHYAITAGIHASESDWLVVMDGDLQDRPEVIPELYKKAQEGYEVVFVSRMNRPEKLYYKVAQKLFYKLLNLFSGLDFNSKQANFSIIKKNVVNAFNLFPENSRFYVSTIKWLGFKTSFLNADHGTRFSGSPSYTLRKRIKLAMDIILAFSNKPLQIIAYLGIVSSIFSSFLVSLLLIGKTSIFEKIDGAVISTVVLFVISGVILLVLGVLGIYIGNIYTQVKQRPLYVISEKVNL